MRYLLTLCAILACNCYGTELCRAITSGDEQKALQLIAQGQDLEEEDAAHWWPLHYAVEKDSIALTKALLNAGANPNHMQNQGFTALDAATLEPDGGVNLEMLRLLLDCGADPNLMGPSKRSVTPAFHLSAYCAGNEDPYLEVLRIFIDYEANPYLRCPFKGFTAFEMAAVEPARDLLPSRLEGKELEEMEEIIEASVDRYLMIKEILEGGTW